MKWTALADHVPETGNLLNANMFSAGLHLDSLAGLGVAEGAWY